MRRMFSVRSGGREAEVLVEAEADVVAVEDVGRDVALEKEVLDATRRSSTSRSR
jgi:hypothetical protein